MTAIAMRKKSAPEETVLVGVLKNRRDRDVLFREHWYRMPVLQAPKRKFRYLALYQPADFGRGGKLIRYYARVLRSRVRRRRTLLPREPQHPRAREPYVQVRVGKICMLARPIRNVLPRRVSFGFTTLRRLLAAKNLLQLYGVVPTEQIVRTALRRAGIPAVAQQYVSGAGKRCRLDFAIFCRRGPIAIECDNAKAHAGRRQRARDRAKDAFLRQQGWTVIRLAERDIIASTERCQLRVRRAMKKLGGLRGNRDPSRSRPAGRPEEPATTSRRCGRATKDPTRVDSSLPPAALPPTSMKLWRVRAGRSG